NTASVTTAQVPGPTEDMATTPVVPPQVVVTKAASPSSGTAVAAGDTITYTLTATIGDAALTSPLVLLDTLGPDELLASDAETVLHRLFHEENRRLFPARGLRFECPCSRQRVARMLRSLGRAELEDIVASSGVVEVNCEFCNQQYRFDRLDVGRLLASDLPEDEDGDVTVH
ncbi:MAG: Hsp33 family molecular chaperone HslO, partial [Wenzhouxiangellaceae bacterium]